MKFTENRKRFWTLDRHHAAGFTLVELIVVIAILAILAGVAIPAYSGYVKKAERAGDEQLLAAVNTAFAAACIDNGTDVSQITQGAYATIDAATGKLVAAGMNQASPDTDPYKASFDAFFEGNENSTFKTFKTILFDYGKCAFVESGSGDITLSYNGHYITISGEAIVALQNSTFGTTIGGAALLNEVAGLTNLVSNDDIDLDALLADEDYMRSFASYIGVSNADSLSWPDDLNAAIDAKMAEGNYSEEQGANALVNGLVYYAADKSTQMDPEEITTLLTSGNIYGNINREDQGAKLAQSSMAYGMYTAFVNSDYYDGTATSATADPMAAIQTISGNGEYSEAFTEYMNSSQGQADLNAYMSAMGVINDSTGNDATKQVLLNGFDDPDLIALLTNALGK